MTMDYADRMDRFLYRCDPRYPRYPRYPWLTS